MDNSSTEACSTQLLNYNNFRPVQNVIDNVTYVEYPCLTNSLFDANVPLEFRIDRTNALVDLTGIYLGFTAAVYKEDGTKLAADEKISTVNNFGYSLFSAIDLYLQDQKLSVSQGYFGYSSYVRMLLFTTENEKKYCLRQALWRRDDPGFMDSAETDAKKGINQGFVNRSAYIVGSVEVQLLIKLVFDFSIQQLLPDQLEVFLRMYRNQASSCLIAAKKADYKIKLSNARIYVPKYHLTPQGGALLSEKLNRGLLCPATKYRMFTKMVAKSVQNLDWSPISGIIPKRIFVFQTLNAAYNGDITKNSFNFQLFNLSKIQVSKNGTNVPLGHGINVKGADVSLLYCLSLEAINCPQCISFNTWDYANGYMVAVFDLTSDLSAANSDYNNPIEAGTIRIQLDYSKPLEESVTVFCLCEEDATLVFDANRNPSWGV